jgi:hypothetical protein
MFIEIKKGDAMRRFAKVLVAGLLLASVSTSVALANYNKGYKYYKRFIFGKAHIKGLKFLKILGVTTPAQLDPLFKDNGKPLIQLLEKKGYKKAAKEVEVIAKHHALKDLKDFLTGMLNGKIPAD